MERTYTLNLHQDDRVGSRLFAELWRTTNDGGQKLVAELPDGYPVTGLADALTALGEQLAAYRDEHGQLP